MRQIKNAYEIYQSTSILLHHPRLKILLRRRNRTIGKNLGLCKMAERSKFAVTTGRVFSANPVPGTLVSSGSTVNLEISQFSNGFWGFFETVYLTIRWEYVLVGVIMFFIGLAIYNDTPVIRRLTDPPFARGLITFIISVATVGLAFVLVCESFSNGRNDDKNNENNFRRAPRNFHPPPGHLRNNCWPLFWIGGTEDRWSPGDCRDQSRGQATEHVCFRWPASLSVLDQFKPLAWLGRI